jgi:hypothetical protein
VLSIQQNVAEQLVKYFLMNYPIHPRGFATTKERPKWKQVRKTNGGGNVCQSTEPVLLRAVQRKNKKNL